MRSPRSIIASTWPWLGLALALAWAVSVWTTFERGPDPEFPAVVRPTYSPRPPFAYRLSEPGDTLDRVAMYATSVGLALSAVGLRRSSWSSRSEPGGAISLWSTALALLAGAWWFTAVPWPTPDGWHGIGWASLVAHGTPTGVRMAVGLALVALATLAAWPLVVALRSNLREHARSWLLAARRRGMLGPLIVAAVLIAGRAVAWPVDGPSGFWPRWSLAVGLMMLDVALVRGLDRAITPRARWATRLAMAAGVAALVVGGRGLIAVHVPVERLAEVVPGRIFISAIPSGEALETVIRRHGVRTVINLFPEDTPQRSPLWPGEAKVIREHGLNLLQSTSDPARAQSFLDETLQMAQRPDAWPVLVHCHACMDRTPAWLGIYRFVVEGRSLDQVMEEIEQRRGLRPKASVTSLMARELARLAPERFARDADTPALVRNAAGTHLPRAGRDGGEPESTLTHLSDGTADRSKR